MILTFCAVGCGQQSRFSMDAGGDPPTPTMAKAAPEKNVGQGMADKFIRGVVNTVTGFIEWPVQTWKGYKDGVSAIENKAGSKTVGTLNGLLLRGPGHALGRTSSGMLEVLTFWLPNPPDNAGVGTALDAPYAWEDGERVSIFKPSLAEGVKPWGRKIVRGLGNGIGGIVELPGQIKKGAHNGNVGMGIVKGFWFWWGRTANGIGEAVTFLVPNPKDQMGYGFEETWPWDALGQ
jgi:putative exosortase-associated protein (TIGR04073 family)